MLKTTVLIVAAIGILLLPISHLISTKNYLLSKVSIFTKIESRPTTMANAVLAVDALGLKIQVKNASPSIQKRFEHVAVEHLARLHRTYSRWSQTDESLMGSLHLKLTVNASGTVASIEPLISYLTNADFIKAVLAEVRTWKFPKGVTEATEISVPLLFVPKGMDPNTAVQWERNIRRTEEKGKTPIGQTIAHTFGLAVDARPTSKALPSTANAHRQEIPRASSVHRLSAEADVLVGFKTNQTVTLRDKPRFSSKTVHAVDRGTRLAVLAHEGDWLKVKLADAPAIGFVRKEFVTPLD